MVVASTLLQLTYRIEYRRSNLSNSIYGRLVASSAGYHLVRIPLGWGRTAGPVAIITSYILSCEAIAIPRDETLSLFLPPDSRVADCWRGLLRYAIFLCKFSLAVEPASSRYLPSRASRMTKLARQ
jgi:hypothetical protein